MESTAALHEDVSKTGEKRNAAGEHWLVPRLIHLDINLHNAILKET
jgi:hypothetical protein